MRTLITCLLFTTGLAAAQQPLVKDVPADHWLLMPGEWSGDIGTFVFNRPTQSWASVPATGWVLIEKTTTAVTVKRIESEAGKRPPFLSALEANQTKQDGVTHHFYLNVPGIKLTPGQATEVPLKRRALIPQLNHEYQLELAGQPFKFTARNGLRGRDGAHYTFEFGGERYEYLLPGFGWSSQILVAAELDGDGKPDFIIQVDDNNSGTHYVLLSSRAKPGQNPPTAYLRNLGC